MSEPTNADPTPDEEEAGDGGGPLLRARRIQERASALGFDWTEPRGAWEKVAEELEEVREALEARAEEAVREELGDLLFAVVNLTRLADVHATALLDAANRKFKRRFRALEALAEERDVRLGEAGLDELDALWDELKRAEGGPADGLE